MEQSNAGSVKKSDNPIHDLQVIINKSKDWKFDIDEEKLMENLTVYIVKRDGEVLEHGIKVGRRQNINEIII